MNNNWKEYFSFTKKERAGIAILLLLIGFSIAVPYFFIKPVVPDKIKREVFAAKQAQVKQVMEDSGNIITAEENEGVYAEPVKITLFEFDPNTLNAQGWKKLGLSDRMIRTIQNYVSKGARFRKPADLQKIYGFSEQDYERLAPYIRIAVIEKPKREYVKEKMAKAALREIEINTADTTAWIALPGIGSKLANRIVHFREKLGGFYSIEQVGETYGLPDSTFQLIKSRLTCAPGAIQKININTADVNALKQHPYIKWPVANAIVQYRQQHGAYQSVEDLQQIAILTPELYQKIAGYLKVE
jgi:competence protein ComEA